MTQRRTTAWGLAWVIAGGGLAAVPPPAEVAAQPAPRRLVVAPFRATVAGTAAPARPVTVTVRGPDGTPRGAIATRADGAGAFGVRWFTDARRMRAGDTVEAEIEAGDPARVVIPPVSARTDIWADAVSGMAPAGATVEVVPLQPAGPTITTQADGGGRYAAAFAGIADLDRHAHGLARVTLAGGHQIWLDWSAIALRVNLSGSVSARIVGARGQPMSAALWGAGDARLVATAIGLAEPDPAGPAGHRTEWEGVLLRDTLGHGVSARPGDSLIVTVGDDQVRLPLPRLDVTASVADDRVVVATDPGRPVTLTLSLDPPSGPAPPPVVVVADARGLAGHAFGGTADIRHRDSVAVETAVDGHPVMRGQSLGGLSLDLDRLTLSGWWPTPGRPLHADVAPPGGTATALAVPVAADGTFTVDLGHAGGEPGPGTRIAVTDPADPERALRLTVPELAFTTDVVADTVAGRATPGGSMRLTVVDDRGQVSSTHGDPATTVVIPAIAADGSWSATLGPRFDVAAGTLIQAAYKTPEGHMVARSLRVAWLNVQHAGAAVCGHGRARTVTTAVLHDAAQRIRATGITRTDSDGRFGLILADTLGRPIPARSGDSVSVTTGPDTSRLVVPDLAVEADWARLSLAGRLAAGGVATLRRPAGNCGDTVWSATTPLAVDADGTFQVSIASAVPGDGVEIGVVGPDGHRAFRPVVRPRIRAWVETGRVDGRAAALSEVRAVLKREGATIATAGTTADAAGTYRAALRDPAGKPALPRPGDRVEVTASGAVETAVVEPLSLDWSAGDGITVGATPGRAMEIELQLRDRRSVWLAVAADAAGAYRLRPSDMPPRATWSLADITRVQVTTDAAAGPDGGRWHALATAAGPRGVPDPYDPDPRPLPGRAHLPYVALRARLAGR